jgi:hypothetical protein
MRSRTLQMMRRWTIRSATGHGWGAMTMSESFRVALAELDDSDLRGLYNRTRRRALDSTPMRVARVWVEFAGRLRRELDRRHRVLFELADAFDESAGELVTDEAQAIADALEELRRPPPADAP